MSLYKNHAGFQISASKLRLVEVCNKGNFFNLENVDEEFLSDFINFSDKETKLITILQNAFNELNLRSQLTSNIISFTLPSNLFNIIDIPYDDALTKKDLQEHINWELSLLMPYININDIAIQSVEINESVLRNGGNIILILLDKRIIEMLLKFCNRNNLILRYIDNEHLSAINLLNLFKDVVPGKTYMTFLIRENFASIVLIENSIPIHIDMFDYKGTEELITNLEIRLEKLTQKFDDVIEIEKSFVFGDAYTENLLERIRAKTGLVFIQVDPFAKIKCSDNFKQKIETITSSNHYTSAAGIAVRLV